MNPLKLPQYTQLRMSLWRYDALADIELPEGYVLETLDYMSHDDWMESLNATGELGEWDSKRISEWLDGDRHVIQEGTFILTFEGRPIGTTCTLPPTVNEPRSELGWVSIAPDYQGHGLGFQVCLAVLHYANTMKYPGTYLNTDDWRLPAIKTYLKLLFEPEMIHESHQERWDVVFKKLSDRF